jgi:peptidoglycan-associated lipoprotein
MQRRTVQTVFTRVAMAGLLSAGALACGSKAKPAPTTVSEAPTGGDKKNEPLTATITPAQGETAPPADPIFFDYDSYQVADPSKQVLEKVAEYLTKNPGATVTISGHTDDRGTTEYNLMLGDQRAKSAHDYLVRLGIDPIRIKTISFGEERPAATGEGEENWSKNRRDEFNTNKTK